ncbi:MAG TPA: hypothetical protein ACFYD2_09730, partial [Candidatus Avalokitesvara rifleensis]|uniref:hypothetical protein n=1 Tax=Candidatus Avalokitesvara rifleensis TaxID=3367620 RepID=UPI00402645A7
MLCETELKTPKKTPKLSEKQIGYLALRKQGMSIAEASRTVGYNENYGYELEKKLKSYDLTDDFWLSKASKVLKNVMDGKPFGEIKDIKASTAVEAAKMIFDRHQPIVRRQEMLNLHANIDLIDL